MDITLQLMQIGKKKHDFLMINQLKTFITVREIEHFRACCYWKIINLGKVTLTTPLHLGLIIQPHCCLFSSNNMSIVLNSLLQEQNFVQLLNYKKKNPSKLFIYLFFVML